MELALRSLQIGYFIKDWKNMWSFLNRIAPSIQSDSPSSSQQTSHKQATGTILGMRHLPSSLCPHPLEFTIHLLFSRKKVNKPHVSSPPPPLLFLH